MLSNFLPVSTGLESRTRSSEFVALARYVAHGRGDISEAKAFAESRRASPRTLAALDEMLQRTAVPAGTTTSWSDGPAGAYGILASAWIECLRHSSSFDAIAAANGFRPVPLKTRTAAVSIGISGFQHLE